MNTSLPPCAGRLLACLILAATVACTGDASGDDPGGPADAGLLDEITITVVPVLLGAGRPLFGPLPNDLELTLMRSRAYEFGFVQSTYRIDARD